MDFEELKQRFLWNYNGC